MEGDDLKNRTKQFPLRIIRLVKAMAQDLASRTIAAQTIRSGTSVSANYRAASIAKSPKNFINKLRITSEESDETAHWIELPIESNLLPSQKLPPLKQEAEELTRIFLSSIKNRSRQLLSNCPFCIRSFVHFPRHVIRF